jgi:hypothetical protein
MHYYIANAFNDELEKIARPHLLSGVKDKKRKQRLAMGLGLLGVGGLAVGLAGGATRLSPSLLNRVARARSRAGVRASPRRGAGTSTKSAIKSTEGTIKKIDSVLKRAKAAQAEAAKPSQLDVMERQAEDLLARLKAVRQ